MAVFENSLVYLLQRIASVSTTLVLLSLTMGCAARPETGFLTATAYTAPGIKDHTILIATTRQRDSRPGTLFNGRRTPWLDYASVTMSVPPTHVPGRIEWPQTPPGDPRTDFVVHQAKYLDGDQAFISRLNAELAQRPPGRRKVFLFIHGFNVMFAEGLYGFTQIVHDSRTDEVPVLFTWASRGNVMDYLYDLNSATAARDNLEHTLRLLLNSKAERVDILAHSMGNWLLVETMRQIKLEGGLSSKQREKIGSVFLAAPDIDVDVFKSEMRRIGRPSKPYYVILSRDDKALALSKFIAGGRSRLGDWNSVELARMGAVVIDLTNMKSNDPVDHSKYAQLASVAPQLGEVLASGIDKTHIGSGKRENLGKSLDDIVTIPMHFLGNSISIVARQ